LTTNAKKPEFIDRDMLRERIPGVGL